jgi:hypothetical protein
MPLTSAGAACSTALYSSRSVVSQLAHMREPLFDLLSARRLLLSNVKGKTRNQAFLRELRRYGDEARELFTSIQLDSPRRWHRGIDALVCVS